MSRRSTTALAWALAALLFGPGTTALAQDDPKQWSDEEIDKLLREGPVERVSVDLVLLHLTVEDRKGRPVHGLGPEEFTVAEDGRPQTVTVFGRTFDNPIQLAVLLDLSGSMRQGDKLERSRAAIRRLASSLRATDAFALLGFAEGEVAELVRWDESSDRLAQVLPVLEAYGRTALTDALVSTPGLLDERTLGRKAIVLITDGVDNASRLSVWDAMSAARRTGVPIYPVAFIDRSRELALRSRYTPENNVHVLRRYANESGGRLFLVERGEDLEAVVAHIESDLRAQYLLGYTSPGEPDGTYRRVEVGTRSGRWKVRHRRGYYATGDEGAR
jgi:Ca-activated chloride channel family protein